MSIGFDLFEEREQPPISAEMFTTLVVARLRVCGMEVEGQQRLELTIRSGNEPTIAHLDAYYRRYRAEPSVLTPLIQEFVDDVTKGQIKHATSDSYQSIAPNLLPLLVSSAEWQEKREVGVRLIVRPLVRDVGIALVIDETNVITFVGLERFARWQVSTADAYEVATANLEHRARDVQFSVTGDGVETLLVDREADGYAATRAILPSRLADWASRVAGELVLGIPSRGFLIGFSSLHPNLAALAAQVEKDTRTEEHGLSRELLVYREGELEIYR